MPPRLQEVVRCGAVLWKRGNRCKNEAAPGAVYCPAHLCLLAPMEWVTGGYAARLDDGSRPLFRSAAFATISEEIAVARLQVAELLSRDAPPPEMLPALHVVVELIRLQHKIENTVLLRHGIRRIPKPSHRRPHARGRQPLSSSPPTSDSHNE